MTVDGFLKLVKALPRGRFRFFIGPRGQIRANADDNPRELCPITAVTLHQLGEFYDHAHCRYAALMIGIGPGNANLIEHAVSTRIREYGKLRSQILEIIGIADNGTRPNTKTVP